MADENTVADATEDHNAPVEVADKLREATPYERKLRAEAAQYRQRAADTEKASAAAIAQYKADAEAMTAKTRERLIRADLRHHAVKHGLTDMDTLKLFDTSKAEADDEGLVINADTLFEQWQKDKPHFFSSKNTSSTATPPKQSNDKQTIDGMSESELQTFRRQHGIRSRS